MPKKLAKGACGNHGCKERKKLSECKYCKKLYCEVHIKPLMPGTASKNIGGEQGVGKTGHVCPLAYDDLAREVVAKKDDKINVLEEPVVIEADWVIDVKTEQDVEVVRETMLAQTESYRGILVKISLALDAEKRDKIAKELTEFAEENGWEVNAYNNTKLHFTPPRNAEEKSSSAWDKFVKWLGG